MTYTDEPWVSDTWNHQPKVNLSITGEDISREDFRKVRGGGFDVVEVNQFKERMARVVEDQTDENKRLADRVAELEEQLAGAPAYEGDYDFPAAEINAHMRAQEAIERQWREFQAWYDEQVKKAQAELQAYRDQIPPQIEVHDLVGSFLRYQEWIDAHQEHLVGQARSLQPALQKILQKAGPVVVKEAPKVS